MQIITQPKDTYKSDQKHLSTSDPSDTSIPTQLQILKKKQIIMDIDA